MNDNISRWQCLILHLALWVKFSADNILKYYVPKPMARGTYWDFGADPVGVGIGSNVTLSCLCNILWTSGWILTKFSWLYNWDIAKNWLDFGGLDLIFKVTAVEKLKIHSWRTSFCSLKTPLLVFPWRQFAWNSKTSFLGKIRKYHQFDLCWISDESGKG